MTPRVFEETSPSGESEANLVGRFQATSLITPAKVVRATNISCCFYSRLVRVERRQLRLPTLTQTSRSHSFKQRWSDHRAEVRPFSTFNKLTIK